MASGTDKTRTSILRTKLHPPPATTALVTRTRLDRLLDAGLETPFTLVSAPAGYGKSTLVAGWIASRPDASAWVSLDDSESDLTAFLGYLLAAVQAAVPGSLELTAQMVAAPAQARPAALAERLANEFGALESPLLLVLDDYHRIAATSEVHDIVARLLKRPPAPLHLIMLTRRDPPLPLAQLRAGGQMTELRMEDLRFSEAETTEFLSVASDVEVSAEALAHVRVELEGWAAGLRLVWLAMARADDPDSFLRGLRGGLQQTEQYLFREVLAAQSSEVREWLLQAAVLDQFCPALLQEVCGTDDAEALRGQEFLDLLQERNLFVIGLDARGEWFRFHHLFAALLGRELGTQLDELGIQALHARAARWFESEGMTSDALKHALASDDLGGAADIFERHRRGAFAADEWFRVEQWLSMLPEAIVAERPALLVTKAELDLMHLQLGRVPPVLESAAALLHDKIAEPALLGELDYLRGTLAYWSGDAELSRRNLQRGIPRLAQGARYLESEAVLMLGLAMSMGGDAESGIEMLEQRIQGEAAAHGPYFLTRLIAGLAFIHLTRGDLSRASLDARHMHGRAVTGGIPNAEAWSLYLRGCVRLHDGQFERAIEHFEAVLERRYVFEPPAAIDAMAGLAVARQLAGLPAEALAAAGELRQFALDLNDPTYLMVADSCRARLAVLQGDLTVAGQWAPSLPGKPTPDSLFMWIEVPAITKARALIALGSADTLQAAQELLLELREVSEACHFAGQGIEVAVLLAEALEKQGRAEEASDALQRALLLASPGRWVRPFVEAGDTLARMLRALERSPHEHLVRHLLAALDAREGPKRARTASKDSHDLTHRELDVLELLVKRLQNKEIAAELFISTHTVNDHLKHIYQKLQVGGRREAARRAVELGILDSRPTDGAS